MNTYTKFKTFLLVGFCFSMCLFSCTDQSSNIGLDIQPPDQQLKTVNDSSAQIKIFSVLQEDVLKVSKGNILVGYCVDPILGTYSASSFMETFPSLPKDNLFDEETILDSVTLSLAYSSNYGDTNTIQTIEVFEIDSTHPLEDLHDLPNTSESLNGYFDIANPIGSLSFTPTSADTISIKLDQSIGLRILEADSILFKSPSAFQESVLRGVYLKAKELGSGGSIISFNSSTATAITLHYRQSSTDTVSRTYISEFSSSFNKVNVFERNYSSNIQYFNKDEDPDTTLIDSVFYLHGGFGLEGKMIVSNIQDIFPADTPFTLNKAIVLLETADEQTYFSQDTAGMFGPLGNYYVYVNDSVWTPDYMEVNSSGILFYEYETRFENNYKVDITRQLLDSYENGDDELVISLRPTFNTEDMRRSVIRGYKNPTNALKLRITYVPLNIRE